MIDSFSCPHLPTDFVKHLFKEVKLNMDKGCFYTISA